MGEFREAVGELAQQSAILESVTAVLTWGLAGVDQRVGRVALPNSVDRMVAVCRSLLPTRVQSESLRAEVDQWLTEVKTAYARRNGILHSVWVGPGDDSVHRRVTLKPITDAPLEELTATDVIEVAKSMESLSGPRAAFLGRLAEQVDGPWSVYS